MARTIEAGAPVLTSFSRSVYSEQESSKVMEKQKAMQEELSNVKQQLKAGKTREAVGNYNRARNPNVGYFANAGEIDQLGKDVKRIQSRNPTERQNVWFNDNNARLERWGSHERTRATAGHAAKRRRSRHRGPAVEKLEAAQQLAVAKVTPLHVNLPTRGVRFSFTQVLQTEVNKPMTVALRAENAKTPSWFQRAGLGLLGFGVLWQR